MSDKKINPDKPELTGPSQDGGTDSAVKPAAWSWYQKLGFRIIFVFFLAMSIPIAGGWYNNVFTLDWFHPHYRDIYDIARFQPGFQRLFGGRGNYDDGDGPVNSKDQGDAPGNGGRHGARRHHRDADSTQAGSDLTGAEHGGRHHHNRDSTQKGGNGEHFTAAGGSGHHHHHGGDTTRAGNGEGFRHHHNRDSTQVGGDGSRFAGAGNEGGFRRHRRDGDTTRHGEGGFRHHHHRDSTQVGSNGNRFAGADGEGGGFRRHHHGGDSTQHDAGGKFAGAGHEGNGHHHHHHGDSTRVGGEQFAAGGRHGFGRHHRDSLVRAVDSTGHDSTRTAAIGNGRNHGRGRGGNNNGGLSPKRNFLADYTDWGIAFLIGIAGGLIWTLLDRKSKSYNILYYWIRVVVRYRAGIGIIGFGFTKLFPTQMPYPSLGLLNSNFGDYTAQKIYWLSVGIVPWYQVFGGIVEIAAGTMLFFRKTTTFGAILLAGALGDITFVNYAYDGGVHVYAFYFVFLSLFLLADDIPKLYNLLILERYTVPFRIYPDFRKPWLKYTRIGLKALTFLIFFVILTYTEVINFKYDPYKQPSTAGVKKLRGNYHVTEFKINGQDIPYNPLDSTRWQEATFENWTTLSFKVNRPVVIDPSNGGGSAMKDIQRTFEITGVAGGERAFHYYADTVDKVLYLQDKNAVASRGGGRGGRGGRGQRGLGNADKPAEDNWISKTAWQHIGDEKKMIDPHAWSTRRDREFAQKRPEPKRNRMVLNYNTVDGSRVILSGINERKDSIYVVLDRYDRKYTLPGSTLVAGKY